MSLLLRRGARLGGRFGGGSGGVVSSTGGLVGVAVNVSDGVTRVGGGQVWLYNQADTTRLYELMVDGSGNFSTASQDIALTPATYRVRDQPPGPFSTVGNDYVDVVVVAGPPTTQNFQRQAALFYNDGSNLGTTAQALDDTMIGGNVNVNHPFRNFPFTGGYASHTAAGGGTIVVNPTGGIGGRKCIELGWPDRSATPSSGAGANFTVGLEARGAPAALATATKIYFRMTDLFDAGWHNGGGTPVVNGSGNECKTTWLCPTATGSGGQTAFLIHELNVRGPVGSPFDQLLKMRFKLLNHNNGGISSDPGDANVDYNLPNDFCGGWHSFVSGVEGVLGATQTMVNIIDGVRNTDMVTSGFYPGGNALSGLLCFFLGLNINNGPNRSGQYRRMQEWALYLSRPGCMQGIAA